MKKICFFSGDITRSGGTEKIASTIVNTLSEQIKKSEAEFCILSLFESTETPFFQIHPVIKRHILFSKPVSLSRAYIPALFRLRHFLNREKIDILIDVDIILSVLSIPATFWTRIKVISWEHFHYHENLGCKVRDFGRRLAMRYASAIVTLTDADRQNYLNAGSKVPVIRIYNPVVSPIEKIHYDANSKIILSAGRLTYQKGFDMVPEIAAEIFKHHPDWQWIIVGEGEDRAKIEAEIKIRHLENNLLLPGRINNISDYYQKTSIFVLPSRFEGFVLVLTEAFSYKLPCVAFNCPQGPDEIIKNQKNGFLIPCFHTHEMTTKILALIESTQIRINFSEQTQITIEKFNLNTILDQWICILELKQ